MIGMGNLDGDGKATTMTAYLHRASIFLVSPDCSPEHHPLTISLPGSYISAPRLQDGRQSQRSCRRRGGQDQDPDHPGCPLCGVSLPSAGMLLSMLLAYCVVATPSLTMVQGIFYFVSHRDLWYAYNLIPTSQITF